VVASDIASNAITDAKISGMSSSKLSGALPAIDGSALTGVSGGKILQVVMGTTSTAVMANTATYKDTGLSATITPSATSSKILAIVTHHGSEKDAGNVNTNQRLWLVRGSTNISESGAHLDTGVSAATYMDGPAFSYLDSPSTTSATTYKTTFRATSGYGITYVNLGGESSIVLMEVSA
jgi:hypothetical protein